MAEVMQFDLVAPERRLWQTEARSVRIPGEEGELTVMPDHQPLITTLKPGILQVEATSETRDYIVIAGFAEVGPETCAILAEEAMAKDELTQERIDALIRDAAERRRDAVDDQDQTALTKFLADLMAVGTEIGLDPKEPNL